MARVSSIVRWTQILFAASTLAASARAQEPLRVIAEWEPAVGTLVTWPLGIPAALAVELAEDEQLFVIVKDAAGQSAAAAAFAGWGIDPTHVEYILAPVQTHWPRDWGPHQAFDAAGNWTIVDPIFRGYPWVAPTCGTVVNSPGGYLGDDAVNGYVAAYFGASLSSFPGYLTGGNILVDGFDTAFSTCTMIGENLQLWTEPQFLSLAQQYLGVEKYRQVAATENNGIQHIDCWFKPLDEETLLVKRAPVGHEEYARIEANVTQLAALKNHWGRPYRILRIDCPYYNASRIAAYCNSLILNRKVLVPLFNIPGDAQAIATFQAALPGYEVIGYPWGSWYYYDALHCRTRAVFDRAMLRMTHRRLDDVVPALSGHRVEAFIDDKSGAGLVPGTPAVNWRVAGAATWNSIALAPTGAANTYAAEVPGQTPGTRVEYFVAAADLSGRNESLPRGAPSGFYAFDVAPAVGTNYCTSGAHGARIGTTGSASVAANDLVLHALSVPKNVFGIFFYGDQQKQLPFGNGTLCVGATVALARLGPPDNAGVAGELVHALDVTSPPTPSALITPGSSWNFQAWFRDGASFDLSDAIQITFVP
ncbi:MAG: agmatine deiminase family protein [Planctomycetes bacterium]|nr:agmatine deiminase family protein [Planctomycetota bacterium]